MGPAAHILPCGQRLHLQHGPIDLIIGAEGDRQRAFELAAERFRSVLNELVGELPALRAGMRLTVPMPKGFIARRMHNAALGVPGNIFFTRMAAVAGAVADEILDVMARGAELERAYVNNGGDIAIHLSGDKEFRLAMSDHLGRELGKISIGANDGIGGIATSGRHGRSFSLGIADSVTVLAATAAQADVAATLIANGVDLPGHPNISRAPANRLDTESDLGSIFVVTGCETLSDAECETALHRGCVFANTCQKAGLINAAALFLQDKSSIIGCAGLFSSANEMVLS